MSIASSFYRWITRSWVPTTGLQSAGPEGPADNGVTVTDDRAMQVAAAWACTRLLAEVVASLPLMLYQRTPGGRKVAVEHPLYRILHSQPNSYQTAVEFRETMQLQVPGG